MVFLVGGANSASGFSISNSLRFNNDDTAYLNRTRSSQSNTTATFSVWTKMGHTHNTDHILFGGASSGTTRSYVYFSDPNGQVGIFSETSDSTDISYASNGLFRDSSAWYHVVVAIDTTDGTAGNRFKMFINGTQYTDWATATAPSQNAVIPLLGASAQTIGGGTVGGGSVGAMAEGYMADCYYIDGQQLDASYFGETDDNGVWIPKKYLGTYGTNGFKLEFQQTGTGTASASTIGADTSGSDNHLTSNNLAATDVTTDTPTNNFATMNPLALTASTFAEGNLKLTGDGGNYDNNVPTIAFDIATTNGWYMEVKLVSGATSDSVIGICKTDDANLTVNASATAAGTAADAVGYRGDGQKKINNSNSSYGNSYTDGDLIGVLVKDGTLKFSKNGTIQNSGTAAATSLTGLYYIVLAVNGSAVFEANFGNAPFSISSGNADANGYGNFEYAPPSGYYSLCTKNLAEYG